MLDKLAKTMKVVSELRSLPVQERVWLLEECKRLIAEQRKRYHLDLARSPGERAARMTRLATLDVVERLLNTISVRF